MARPRKNTPHFQSTTGPLLSKGEVVKNIQNGLYREYPELFIPHALGESLEPWQKKVVGKLFLPGHKKRISVRAGHGCGKTYLSSRLVLQFLLNNAPSIVICTGPCVEENEKIFLADGRWVKIKELDGREFNIWGINDDLSTSLSRGRAFPNGIRPVFKLITKSGRYAIRTGNHPFMTFDGWKSLLDLRIGEYVAIPTKITALGDCKIDENIVKIIAYMITEGCTSQIKAGHISFTQNSGPILDEFSECVKQLGCHLKYVNGRNYTIRTGKKGSPKTKNAITEICRKFGLDGQRAWEKKIPQEIFSLDKDLKRIFLSRLFAGDGWIRKTEKDGGDREIGYACSSEELTRDVSRMLMEFGIRGRTWIRKKENITKGSLSKRDMFCWYASGSEAIKFITEIGIFGSKKEQERILNQEVSRERLPLFDMFPNDIKNYALNLIKKYGIGQGKIPINKQGDCINRKQLQKIALLTNDQFLLNIGRDDLAWDEIVQIEPLGLRMTYGIEVDNLHTYVTDFFEHNTGKQVRNQFWSQLDTAVRKSVFSGDMEVLKQKAYVKGYEELWKVLWVTSKDPKTIEGFHGPDEGKNLMWVIEEAKGVADPVFEALSGALSHENNLLYISSTCGPPRGHFFDSHHKLRKLYETEHIPSTLSSRVSPEQIDIWREQWGGEDSPVFQARVLAEFPEFDDSYIASLNDLMDAIEEPGEGEIYS